MLNLLQHPQFAGSWRMLVAMLMSGTIGLFVVESGQDTATVVFYRCLLGGAALLLYLSWQRGWQKLSVQQSGYLLAGGLALVANWFACLALTNSVRFQLQRWSITPSHSSCCC